MAVCVEVQAISHPAILFMEALGGQQAKWKIEKEWDLPVGMSRDW
jgi:hypothetical protein